MVREVKWFPGGRKMFWYLEVWAHGISMLFTLKAHMGSFKRRVNGKSRRGRVPAVGWPFTERSIFYTDSSLWFCCVSALRRQHQSHEDVLDLFLFRSKGQETAAWDIALGLVMAFLQARVGCLPNFCVFSSDLPRPSNCSLPEQSSRLYLAFSDFHGRLQPLGSYYPRWWQHPPDQIVGSWRFLFRQGSCIATL